MPFSLSPLDRRLVVPKPKNSIDEKTIAKLILSGRLVMTRKRDGHRHLLSVAGVGRKTNVHICTRTMNEQTLFYPHIVERAHALRIPRGTLLDGELSMDKDGVDSVTLMGKLLHMSAGDAVTLQATIGRARYRIFNVVAHKGKLLTDVPFKDRAELLLELFDKQAVDDLFAPIEFVPGSFDDAVRRVKSERWEGMVLYDRDATTALRLDGDHESPPRPVGAWKWKPIKEDDFFVRTWEWGTSGKAHAKRMGKLHLLQIDPETKEEISCGEVGIGFSDDDREFFAHKAVYPLAVQVGFLTRYPSGACREPRYLRLRDDKTPKECILPEELRKTAKRAGRK